MESLRSSASLLASVIDSSSLAPLLTELGFEPEPQLLDTPTRDLLGIPGDIHAAKIAQGIGALRALIIDDRTTHLAKDLLGRIGTKVSSQSPHLLWLIVAVRPHMNEVALAVCEKGMKHTRIKASVINTSDVFDSDAETFCGLSAAKSESDILTYNRWIEILGRNSVTRKFFRTLERLILDMSANDPIRKEIALLYATRLIFLSFLETKGWLNGDFGFLVNSYAECMSQSGEYHRRVLEPLFFGTLNTRSYKRAKRAHAFGSVPFLNGGLFSRTPIEKLNRHVRFTDEELGNFFGDLLTRYRFTAREDSGGWTDAAVDPEMLGKAFESLMCSDTRKKSGAFYTPQSIVEKVSEYALANALDADINQLPTGYKEKTRLLTLTSNIRILDPACGSGAFLVHVLEKLSSIRCALLNHGAQQHMVRREVLMRSIFGVDVNPTAVWLCEMRLWLSVVIDNPERNPMRVLPLPNLDRNIRIGDSLSGGDFQSPGLHKPDKIISSARERYARATGTRKKNLAKVLDREERKLALAQIDHKLNRIYNRRKEIICPIRSQDLFGDRKYPPSAMRQHLKELSREARETRKMFRALKSGGALPFFYAAQFPEIQQAGGFDVVVGNPPWVRIHHISLNERTMLKREFEVFRNAAWTEGAAAGNAGKGFAAQIDKAALFVERSMKLVRDGGIISLLLPSKLWYSLAGGGIRSFVRENSNLIALHDMRDSNDATADNTFDAAVYPSILVTRSGGEGNCKRITSDGFNIAHNKLPLDDSRGSPWLIIPPAARDAFDAVSNAGVPFLNSSIGRPSGGVKTGFNNAFIVKVTEVNGDLAYVESSGLSGQIERCMLRPLLKGGTGSEWRASGIRDYIIWTHDRRGKVLDALPPNTCKWLSQWRHQLSQRSDLYPGAHWWSLFRTDSSASACARVVWPDIGKKPKALVLPVGDQTIPLNTCYVTQCRNTDDAFALAALLNSKLAAAWLNTVAEPARGGYKRYIAWTTALLPIPKKWDTVKHELIISGRNGFEGTPPSDDELLATILAAYGLRRQTIAPLLEWSL